MGNCFGKKKEDDEGEEVEVANFNKHPQVSHPEGSFNHPGSGGQKPAAFRRESMSKKHQSSQTAPSMKHQSSQTDGRTGVPKPQNLYVMDKNISTNKSTTRNATNLDGETRALNPEESEGQEEPAAVPDEDLREYRDKVKGNPQYAPFMQRTYIPTQHPGSPNDAEPAKDMDEYKKEIMENKVYAPYLGHETKEEDDTENEPVTAGGNIGSTANGTAGGGTQIDGVEGGRVDSQAHQTKLDEYKKKLQPTSYSPKKSNKQKLTKFVPQQH